MARWIAALVALSAAAIVAVVLTAGSTAAQAGEDAVVLRDVKLFGGGVAAIASYDVHCGPADEGFRIRTNIAHVNGTNGLIAKGEGETQGECPAQGGAGVFIASETDAGFSRGEYGGGQQFCFGDLVDGEVDCEPGGGGLLEGRIR